MGNDEADKFWEHYNQMPKEVRLKYMEQRFSDILFDMSKDWEDYDIEHEELDRLKQNTEFHEIPSMVVHKDDIISLYEGRDDFENIITRVTKLSYDDMETIVGRMTDMMMEQFHIALQESFERQVEDDSTD